MTNNAAKSFLVHVSLYRHVGLSQEYVYLKLSYRVCISVTYQILYNCSLRWLYQIDTLTKCEFPLFHIIANTQKFIFDSLMGEK